MEYLFDRLIQLLDEDALLNMPKDVLAEFVREIDRADFPLIPNNRAVIGTPSPRTGACASSSPCWNRPKPQSAP